MNERFVAVSTVTRSRMCGCFSKLRRDLVSRGGGNRWWMQLDGLSNWGKNHSKACYKEHKTTKNNDSNDKCCYVFIGFTIFFLLSVCLFLVSCILCYCLGCTSYEINYI